MTRAGSVPKDPAFADGVFGKDTSRANMCRL
jgi:hypothetical protein